MREGEEMVSEYENELERQRARKAFIDSEVEQNQSDYDEYLHRRRIRAIRPNETFEEWQRRYRKKTRFHR